jgi:arginine utilization regulatory protein
LRFYSPLRERREDILPLVDFFIDRYNSQFRKSIRGIADDTRRLLLDTLGPERGNSRTPSSER